MKGMANCKRQGMFLIQSAGLRESCLPFPERIVASISRHLPQISCARNEALLKIIKVVFLLPKFSNFLYLFFCAFLWFLSSLSLRLFRFFIIFRLYQLLWTSWEYLALPEKVKENMKLNIVLVLRAIPLFADLWLSPLPPFRPLIKRRNFDCFFTSIGPIPSPP